MASSDDHADDLPKFVSDYSFVDDKETPVPFSTLPVKWSNDESTTYTGKQIFLDGRTDDGRQKIYKPVKAWKFDLTGLKPEISVLLEDNNWIKLQRARKSYEPTIRTILITVHCLHIARKNQDISAKSLWDQLARTFSLYEVRPSVNDLIDHFALIEEVVKKDERLAKSKAVWTALKKLENSGSIGDEKAVCEPSALSHTVKWQATPKLAGTVNWGTATVVGLFAGMLYGGSKEAAASASKDAEVMLKLGSTTDKREQHRLMRDAMEKRFIRITRGSIVGGVRLGTFTATFFGLQNLLADKRGVYDVLNIVGAGSATAAGFGLIMPGSLKWRARNVMLGSVLGAAFGFPIGWAHLKLVEKANKEGLVAQSQLDEKEKATVGIGAATARIDGSLSK